MEAFNRVWLISRQYERNLWTHTSYYQSSIYILKPMSNLQENAALFLFCLRFFGFVLFCFFSKAKNTLHLWCRACNLLHLNLSTNYSRIWSSWSIYVCMYLSIYLSIYGLYFLQINWKHEYPGTKSNFFLDSPFTEKRFQAF